MFESEPVQWLKKRNDKFLILSTLIISSIFFLSRIYEPSLSSDEAKYALIAKNMLISKNFLMPDLTLNLYLKKPPFFFWLIALSIKAFGTNEFAVRFPSAMFAVIDSILIYTLVRKITGDKLISFLSSMIFTVNFEVIRISTIARLESFTLFVNLAIILVLISPDLKKAILSGFLLGIGLLTKGPLALPGITALLTLNLIKRDFKNLTYYLLTIMIGTGLFSTYLFITWKMYPGFLQEFFGNQILGRLTGTLKEGTPKPIYFYERIILKHFWIWNLFLIYGIFVLVKNRFSMFKASNKDLFLAFTVFFFIIFSGLHAISLKFTRYSYYLYPFLSFFVASVISSKANLSKYALIYIVATCLIYGLLASSCPCTFHKDKLKDLRPLLKIGTSNFNNLGISKTIAIYTAYALLFYFPLETKQPKYLISRGKICEKAILKHRDYCIVKVKDENSPINHSYWMEWRN